MGMGEQMILAIFVISVAFRTEAKFQIVPVQLCAAADGTFMLCNAFRRCAALDLLMKMLSSAELFWRDAPDIPVHQKEDQEVGEGRKNDGSPSPSAVDKPIYGNHAVKQAHPLHFNRN